MTVPSYTGPLGTKTPLPVRNDLRVYDSFDDGDGVLLVDHDPDVAWAAANWTSENGTWEVQGNKAQLAVGPAGDQLAFIGVGTTEPDISADVEWQGGAAGLCWGVASPAHSIVFWDGVNDLVAGNIDGTGFHEVGRVAFSWSLGDVKRLRARLTGGVAVIYANGTLMMQTSATADPQENAGLFVNGGGPSRFKHVTVRI